MNILVLYHYEGEYPVRAATADHLYCFGKYAGPRCVYVNLAFRRIPRYVKRIKFDLVIFHTLFLSARWHRALFEGVLETVAVLKSQTGAVKVALPQDEFLNTDLLNEFINDFGVDYVFSVAPESEWGKIYDAVDRQRVKFARVLTGYLDEQTLKKIDSLQSSMPQRVIDVGYRAYHAPAWLGRHGLLKVEIADVFRDAARESGLVADISTRARDTFLGDAWYEFLLRCKFMIGVEGGASILDSDGSIRARTEAYVHNHPEAGFEKIEAACFPNLDGNLNLFAISPRHLEACATRTCQVLVEGEYNGVLRPGQHYIELRRDLGNLPQVIEAMKDDQLRQDITERAWQDVVASGRYTYSSFVRQILETALAERAPQPESAAPSRLLLWWAALADRLSWMSVMFHWYVILNPKRKVRRWLVNTFSEEAVSSAMRRIKRKAQV